MYHQNWIDTKTKEAQAVSRLMNISLDFDTDVFGVQLCVLLASFQSSCLSVGLRYTAQINDLNFFLLHLTFCKHCYLNVFFVVVVVLFVSLVSEKTRRIDTSDSESTENGNIIPCHVHSPAQQKKAVTKDWIFCCCFTLRFSVCNK